MISNQHITIYHRNDRRADAVPLTMLTWPAGAALPRRHESVVWFTAEGERRCGEVFEVSHEHRLRTSNAHSMSTPDVSVTIWVEVR